MVAEGSPPTYGGPTRIYARWRGARVLSKDLPGIGIGEDSEEHPSTGRGYKSAGESSESGRVRDDSESDSTELFKLGLSLIHI